MTSPTTTRNNERQYYKRGYLDAIADHIVIFDGAMGTNIQLRKLNASHYGGEKYDGLGEMLVMQHPEIIQEIHESFLAVGSEEGGRVRGPLLQ